jgi:hypothetical protein
MNIPKLLYLITCRRWWKWAHSNLQRTDPMSPDINRQVHRILELDDAITRCLLGK